MTGRINERLLFAFLLVIILVQAIFAAFPGIDLATSALFADGRNGFPWANGTASVINLIIRRLGEVTAVVLVLWLVYGALTGMLDRNGLRVWGYAAASVVLSSGCIVNLLLKSHVGRARPAFVQEFGGSAAFTPAWQVTDQCSQNCSFASGEVALAASLSVVAVVLLWPRLMTRQCVLAILLGVAYTGIVAMLRIGLGRHFLSDAVFSALFSTAVAFALYPLFGIVRARTAFDPKLPLTCAARWGANAHAAAMVWIKRPT